MKNILSNEVGEIGIMRAKIEDLMWYLVLGSFVLILLCFPLGFIMPHSIAIVKTAIAWITVGGLMALVILGYMI